MRRFVTVALVLAVACCTQSAFAQEPAANPTDTPTALAMEILTVTDAKTRIMTQVSILEPALFKLIGQAHPGLSQDTLDEIQLAINEEMQASMDDLLRNEAQIYARHFTEDDMRSLLAFYRTDVGRKFVAEMPVIMKESGEFAHVWAHQLADHVRERVLARLKSKGIKI